MINELGKEEELTFTDNETVTISVSNYERLKTIAAKTSLERKMHEVAQSYIKSIGMELIVTHQEHVTIVTKEQTDKFN